MAPLDIILSTLFFAFLVHFFLILRTLLLNRHRLPFPPGPKPWPILGNLPHLGPKPHQTLAALARTYGPLLHLRLGSVHAVVASSPAVAYLFLKSHGTNFSSRPPNSGAKHLAYNYQDLVFAPYGPRWRVLRKICSLHLLSPKALKSSRQVREGEVSALVCALAKEGEGVRRGVVNLGNMIHECSTNVLARAMIGRRIFGDLREGGDHKDAEEFKKMVVELMTLAGAFNVGDFVPALEPLDLQGVVRKMKRVHKRFDTLLNGIIADHRKGTPGSGSGHTDLLSVLMALKDEDGEEGIGKLSDTEIKALLLNLITAGTDTSTSAVEWAMTELIRHPDILATAQRELDSVVGPDRLVSEPDLANLPFLHAVVKETFRLHPSTPLSLPRIAAEDCEINGYFIPRNSTLLVNVWAIGRDPSVWSEPLEFQPSRFLPGSKHAHIDARGNDFELIPFGAGRRICAGMSMGIHTVQFMTATLVHAFDWAFPDGQSAEKLDMEEAFGISLQKAQPLTVCPLPRLAPIAYA